MWEHLTIKNAWARSVLLDAEKERQEGRDGHWQQESPYNEEPNLVKHSRDLRFEGLSMRRAYYAGRSGVWESYLEEFQKDDRLSVWANCKSEGMLQRGRNRGRIPLKHCAGHFV